MTLSAGARLGPYEILAPIGSGGMGEVYRARDTRLERIVALKTLPSELASSEALARFEREVKSVAALSHPNILAIHDFGIHDGVPFAVMELLEGETLRDRIADSAIPPRKAVEYGLQIARGLAAAHERGIVHRDLKPENVFVTRDGLVKILDFGLARRTADGAWPSPSVASGPSESATRDGVILGTVGYMAPEQARGRPVDHRCDIFSFGAILYEMLSGRRAFSGETMVDTLMSVVQDDPLPLEGVPSELTDLVAHCLEKDANDRFQTARDLAFALQMADRGRSGSSRTPAPESALSAVSSSGSGSGETSLPSIAVLPLRNMSAEKDAEYFSDGMTEEIITALTGIETLRVAARTSAFAYKGKDLDVRQIGRELGVKTVLEGSVRHSGKRIRITAQLIDVASGYHLWSEKFDRDAQDVFALQDEIARAIAAALKVRLVAGTEASLVAATTRDVEAYDHFLKGRYHWNRRRMKLAIEEFRRAIELDPGYAAAHTALADSWAVWGFYGGIPTWEAYARARDAAERAADLAPDSVGVLVSLGVIEHYYGWNTEREERLLTRASELDPRGMDAWFWLTLCLSVRGRFEDSLRTGRAAAAAEPHSGNARCVLGWAYAGSRRFDEALPEFDKAVELAPDASFPLWSLGLAQRQLGRAAEAAATLERAVEVTGREHFFEMGLLVDSLAGAGRASDAEKVMAELEARAKETYVPPFDLALASCALGRRDQSLAYLERAYDERNALLWYRIHIPVFDVLRDEPRWQAIAEKLARTAPLKPGGGW